jgi:epoxyqueuosine reductase
MLASERPAGNASATDSARPPSSDVGPPDRRVAARILREEAEREGFSRFGIARAGLAPRFERYERWLAEGRQAGMRYLAETAEARRSPDEVLPGARSVVCLAAPHRSAPFAAPDGARFGRYAAGPDYHGTLRQRALRVVSRSRPRLSPGARFRVCVDSMPLAERSFAAAAGLGWIGKNGCLIDSRQGSYLLLAEILTDLDLPPDEPVAELCGSCTRCLDACPTSAFVEPGVLDAGRCLAYWTIEHRGAIPGEWKARVGSWVFGCDVCQEVCPWNLPVSAAACEEDSAPPGRLEILSMGKGAWRRRFGATALNRAGWRGLQRNAAASAGAIADTRCRAALARAAACPAAGLEDAARWALERLAGARL